jgi:hypothetical protein
LGHHVLHADFGVTFNGAHNLMAHLLNKTALIAFQIIATHASYS